MPAILVHGGAGSWDRHRPGAPVDGVAGAAETGAARLREGASALDAAIAAVAVLEDDPTFNAGTGASLNLEGRAEMDAGVMAGAGLATGAVAVLDRVRSPVGVARAVMEHSGHCLLAGEGARRFARALGHGDFDPVTAGARRRWQRHRERLDAGEMPDLARAAELLRGHPEPGGDTVGAVALDAHGGLAAATSTGGTSLKLPGRIGDSALAGAGFYADAACAVAATGRGELMLRFGAARAVADRVRSGSHPQEAVRGVITAMAEQVGSEAGLIAVDHRGRAGIHHRTPEMPHALAAPSEDPEAHLYRE